MLLSGCGASAEAPGTAAEAEAEVTVSSAPADGSVTYPETDDQAVDSNADVSTERTASITANQFLGICADGNRMRDLLEPYNPGPIWIQMTGSGTSHCTQIYVADFDAWSERPIEEIEYSFLTFELLDTEDRRTAVIAEIEALLIDEADGVEVLEVSELIRGETTENGTTVILGTDLVITNASIYFDADVELASSIRIVEHDGNYLHIRFGGLNTASQSYIATAAGVTSQVEEIFDIAARNPDVTPEESGFDPTPIAWG